MYFHTNLILLFFLCFLIHYIESLSKSDAVKVKFSMKVKSKVNVAYVSFIPNYVYNLFRVNKVTEFLGIPYARPPLDYFRFKRTHSHFANITNDRVFYANKSATPCLQRPINTGIEKFDYYNSHINASEDCLQMNMWVPEDKTGAVIVFFHGGDLVRGSASLNIYNGSFLSAYSKAIIINVNYRLQVYGFAYLGRKTKIPGNMGLLDQQLALQWINEHIKDFGGLPNKVTIFGHEAGAAAAAAHLYLKGTKRLFKRIILSSGVFPSRRFTNSHYHVINRTKELGELMICKNQTSTLIEACLSQREESVIHRFYNHIRHVEDQPLRHIFGISNSDRRFFTKTFTKLFIRSRVDVLIGRTEDEGSQYFLDFVRKNFKHLENFKESFEKALKQINEINDKLYKKVAKEYRMTEKIEKKFIETYVRIINETFLIGPKIFHDMHSECDWFRFMNKLLSRKNNTVYSYLFKRKPENMEMPHWLPKVITGSDIEYIFGLPFREFRRYNKSHTFGFEAIISTKMMQMVGQFADTGIPIDDWIPSRRNKIRSLLLDNNYGIFGTLRYQLYKPHGRCIYYM